MRVHVEIPKSKIQRFVGRCKRYGFRIIWIETISKKKPKGEDI